MWHIHITVGPDLLYLARYDISGRISQHALPDTGNPISGPTLIYIVHISIYRTKLKLEELVAKLALVADIVTQIEVVVAHLSENQVE